LFLSFNRAGQSVRCLIQVLLAYICEAEIG